MTKYITFGENEIKEFDSYQDAIKYAKNNMDETDVVFMQTESDTLLWKKLLWKKQVGGES